MAQWQTATDGDFVVLKFLKILKNCLKTAIFLGSSWALATSKESRYLTTRLKSSLSKEELWPALTSSSGGKM